MDIVGNTPQADTSHGSSLGAAAGLDRAALRCTGHASLLPAVVGTGGEGAGLDLLYLYHIHIVFFSKSRRRDGCNIVHALTSKKHRLLQNGHGHNHTYCEGNATGQR